MTSDNRIAIAQWILDKNLDWIAAADAKAGFVIAIDTAMLTGLAAAYTQVPAPHTAMQIVLTVTSGALAILSLGATALTFRSRTNGPSRSMIFFLRIAESPMPMFVSDLKSKTEDELLDDIAAQIHRNAEIARDKHWWAGRSVQLGFGAAILLVGAALVLLR